MSFYLFLSILSASTVREPQLDSETCKSQLTRNLFGIIWSCLSTIIICAWTSVHPNVPPPHKWKARWNRLRLMFWMIIAPELVLAWAVRQHFAAKDIRDAYNTSRQGLLEWTKWTLAHGHLLGMGGFTLVDPDLKKANPKDQNAQVLTVYKFEQLIEDDPNFEFPDLTTAEIHDRSKGDALSKLIAILQTTWFIVQCVARGQQRLAVTELELVTLALASLNAVTFGFWWYKPLGVQEPVKIYLKTEAEQPQSAIRQKDETFHLSYVDILSRSWGFILSELKPVHEFLQSPCRSGPVVTFLWLFVTLPLTLAYVLIFAAFVLFPFGIILLLQIIKTEPVAPETSQSHGFLATRIVVSLQRFRYSLSAAIGRFVERRLVEIFEICVDEVLFFSWFFVLPLLFVFVLLIVTFLIPLFTLLFLVSFIFTAVFGIVTTDAIPSGASHVPSFYAPGTESDRWSRMTIFALFGGIFGGLHCIGWYFRYPTHTEQVLWQGTSLAITIIPLIVAPVDFLVSIRIRKRDGLKHFGRVERTALLILELIMTILLFFYVPARLSLVAQALALLRHQPPSAFVAVDWTKYVPHILT